MPWLDPPTPFAKQPKLASVRSMTERVLPEVSVEELESGDGWLDINSVELADCVLDVSGFQTVEVIGSRMVGVRLVVGPDTLVAVRNSTLERCDLSRLRSESILRSSLSHCKLTGAEMAGAVIDVEFVDCSIRMPNLAAVHLQRVAFRDCEFVDVDLFEASLKDVSFDGCSIGELSLDRAACERVDFREAEKLDLKVAQDLTGCLVTVAQTHELAPWLAHQLGASIQTEAY